jgi:glyoxylase-like metal-dependent hydrolase (beta-lactamase superfamily II)
MELRRINERVFVIEGPANIGVIRLNNSCVALIDSGNSEKYAQKVHELLSDYRFKVTCILNTHAHSDHIGGNSFFYEKTGCRILASVLEAPTIRQPLIQSAVLFSGAPINDLLNRFIMANPSPADVFSENSLRLDDLEIQILDLPGHSINQKGFLVENTAFIADAVFPEAFFRKQRLPFVYDPLMQLQTLEKLRSIEATTYIGGHFQPSTSIKGMIANSQAHLESSLEFMRTLLKVPQPQDRIVKAFLDNFAMKKTGWEYFLYRATVIGYLSALHRHKEIGYRVLDNLLVWYAL